MTYCIKKYNTNVTAKSRQKPTQNELVEESSWCLNQLLTRHEKRPTCVRWTRRFFSFSRCWTFLIFSSIFRLIFFFIFSIGGLLTLFLENRKYMLLRYVYYILKCQNIENNPNSFANLIIHCKHFQITSLNTSLKGFQSYRAKREYAFREPLCCGGLDLCCEGTLMLRGPDLCRHQVGPCDITRSPDA